MSPTPDPKALFLVKYGELALRGENKGQFELALVRNIRNALEGSGAQVVSAHGRLFVEAPPDAAERVAQVLGSTFGVAAFARAHRVRKRIEDVEEAALRVAAGQGERSRSFKIEARRLDKSFPLTSYEIACRLGDAIRTTLPKLSVDVRDPDLTVRIEIRDHAYVYGVEHEGPRGLPVGTSGRGLLLLSGGIDSPVAGYLMGARGLHLDAVYFHTPPYTGEEALEKVLDICQRLQVYLPGMGLWVVPFTAVQERINVAAPQREVTLLMRACMMWISDQIALRAGGHALVTGESLGQVASQTPQSIRFTGSTATLPVLRPLIGMDKDQIIRVAKRVGTYEVSIRPYSDCCTLFAPRRPLIKPLFEAMRYSYVRLDAEELMILAVRDAQWRTFVRCLSVEGRHAGVGAEGHV
jgi:thiamine biosynthesis protein ThiI